MHQPQASACAETTPAGKTALIAMSGGVDSSLAAKLMLDQGFSCTGCTMKLFDNEDAGIPRAHSCCSLDDVEDARRVAYKLGIPFFVFNFTRDFHSSVLRPFIESYENGRTPNPCIDCNRYLKFGKLFDRARVLHCDYVVTGHYARIEMQDGRYVLKKAVDESKDQSYVLYGMTQAQLARTRFPLGSLRKTEVRALAAQCGFANADKADSQDICFVPDGDYARIIALHSGHKAAAGNFVDRDGQVLGRHRGIIHYTVGQRRGIGIAGPEPLYVCRLCPESGDILLGKNADLFRREAEVGAFNWISGMAPGGPIRCQAKIRYRQPAQWATAIPCGQAGVQLVFDEAQRAVTPGQAAVLYDGDLVLGGGTIL